jgi:starvation-inducible DNA-binding protein
MPHHTDTTTKDTAKQITRQNRQDNPVVQCLHQELANAYVLYANYKHYHWQTYGPHFRDLHLMFDEFAKDVLKTTDEIAERLRMIGQDPVAELRRWQEMAKVHSAGQGQNMREMLQEADANLMVVIKGMREGARHAEENDDPGTVDLFSCFVRIHEKHEWFLRETLKKGDGFHD